MAFLSASASQLVRGNRARESMRVVSFVLLGVALAILGNRR